MTALDEMILRCEQVISCSDNDHIAIETANCCLALISNGPNDRPIGLIERCRYDNTDDALHDLPVLCMKMKSMRDTRDFELEIPRLNAASRGAIINVSQDTTSHFESRVDVSVSIDAAFEQVINGIQGCGLSAGDEANLKSALENLKTSASEEPLKVCEAVQRVLDLVKTGAETARVVAPFISSVLSTVQ